MNRARKVPTEAAFQDWKMHPVTEALKEALDLWRMILMEQWEAKQFQDNSDPHATTVFNAAALAELDLIRRIRELTYEQLVRILGEDDEQETI